MIKNFENVCFGKIYGIEVLGSLKLEIKSNYFTVYALEVMVGRCAIRKMVTISFLPNGTLERYLVGEFQKMIEQIHQEQTKIEIPMSIFEEVEGNGKCGV